MRLPSRKARAAALIAVPAVVILGVGVAYAVNATSSNTKQAESSTAAVSGCDSEYTVTLAAPTYSTAASDYVIASAATDTLEDRCAGQTVYMTVLNNSGAVVSDGSAVVNNATKVATVTFTNPVPVGTTYTVKSAIYGTRAGS